MKLAVCHSGFFKYLLLTTCALSCGLTSSLLGQSPAPPQAAPPPPAAQSQVMTTTTPAAEPAATPIPADQLDSLVAPIALYPDPLLANVLAASTYPLEIIQLQQWIDRKSVV